jgi:hypothetical protein
MLGFGRIGWVQAGAMAALGLGVCGSAAAEWTRTYVVDWYEPASYYGAKDGVTEPGTDCPAGSNPEIDWVKVLVKAGYSEPEAKWLRNPANPSRDPVHGQNQMAFRGKNRENVYIQPWTTPDPGLTGPTGPTVEGFDLDNNRKTGGVSPEGGLFAQTKGVDNQFYRALGCTKSYRGPPKLSSTALGVNDTMRNGGWTVVMVVHGAGKDPMNDKQVDVGFYMSEDKLVKDGNGEPARDYTFRIKPAKLEGLVKAKTVDGVIVSKGATPEMWMRDPGSARDLQLLNARIQFKMREDGGLDGYVGGYRPWRPVYDAMVKGRGPVVEALGWIELPSIYYALQREADYSPTGKKGEKTHISYAMRVSAIPAFVMTPDGKSQVSGVASYAAGADPKDTAPLPGAFGAIDGLIQRPGMAVGNALEMYPVPAATPVAANTGAAAASGGK